MIYVCDNEDYSSVPMGLKSSTHITIVPADKRNGLTPWRQKPCLKTKRLDVLWSMQELICLISSTHFYFMKIRELKSIYNTWNTLISNKDHGNCSWLSLTSEQYHIGLTEPNPTASFSLQNCNMELGEGLWCAQETVNDGEIFGGIFSTY